jgi:PAS domain S-box-containing protein
MPESGRAGGLPRRTWFFILAVALAGCGAIAFRIPQMTRWDRGDLIALAALVVAISVTEQFQIPLRHLTERQLFSLTDALWVAGLLLTKPSILTAAVATGIIAGQAAQRLPVYKIAFNVGQFVLGITAAEIVFGSVTHLSPNEPTAWLAASLGMAAYFVVNSSLVATVISQVEKKRFITVITPPLPLNLLNWVGNMAVGIMGAVMWETSRLGIPLLIVPVVVSFLAYRGWLWGMRERDRMQNLYEAGHRLHGPLDGSDFGQFLGLVERMLDAPAAELVVLEDDRVTVHDAEGTLSLTAARSNDGPARAPEAYVRVRPGLSPYVALIGDPEHVHGLLVVHREQSLTNSERSLLDTLASQVDVRLQNRQLFSETLEQRTQLAEIFGHTSDGIFVVSPEGRMLSWNPAMERITGYSASEAVNRTWLSVFGTQGAEGEELWSQDIVRAGSGEAHQLSVTRKDGVRRWISYTSNPIGDSDTGLKAYVVVARDVTSEMEAERMKADFVATVSHELRTPLTPLKGFLAALLQGTVDDSRPAREEYYRIMLKQANRLERLITDLLEVSRIESSEHSESVESQAVELSALLADQVQEFAHQQSDRQVEFRAPEYPILVNADPFRVGQVVGNLVSNALKYSPPGSPVEIALTSDGQQATVSVRDQGEGIPLADQDRVFERFHRLENGLTRKTSGTGLGLYIAKRLVEAMSGRLWVVSRPGQGSTFSFSLPLTAVRHHPEQALHASGQQNGYSLAGTNSNGNGAHDGPTSSLGGTSAGRGVDPLPS